MRQEEFKGLLLILDDLRKKDLKFVFRNDKPSREFGKAIGLDIHKEWNEPEGVNWNQTQALLKMSERYDGDGIIEELWTRAKKTNPEISNLARNTKDKFNIVFGMASEFNLDDIQEFLDFPYYERKELYRNRLSKIEEFTGYKINWVPSEKTLIKMENWLALNENGIIIKNFESFVNENKKKESYDYGCVMIYFKFPDLKEIQKGIDKKDLYKKGGEYGFEDKPHVTLLYGLHSDEIADKKVLDSIRDIPYGKLKLHNISMFDSPDYDVLKFEVKGTGLTKANKKLKEFPYTSDYPKYNPHSTIAYLKKGKAKEYIEKFKDKEFKISPSHIVYSKPDGTERRIKISS